MRPSSTLDPNQRKKALELIQEQNPRVSPNDLAELTDYGVVNQLLIELENAIVAVEMIEEERSKEER